MGTDKIEIYKDKRLLELTQKMAVLSQEEVEFFFSDIKTTKKGRTRGGVARDMVLIYEATNEYLKNHYPDNTVATSWVGTNQFSADFLKERLSISDRSTL